MGEVTTILKQNNLNRAAELGAYPTNSYCFVYFRVPVTSRHSRAHVTQKDRKYIIQLSDIQGSIYSPLKCSHLQVRMLLKNIQPTQEGKTTFHNWNYNGNLNRQDNEPSGLAKFQPEITPLFKYRTIAMRSLKTIRGQDLKAQNFQKHCVL